MLPSVQALFTRHNDRRSAPSGADTDWTMDALVNNILQTSHNNGSKHLNHPFQSAREMSMASSTVPPSSTSISLSPILPSVFELLAQERFTKFIRSGLQHVLKFLQASHPLSDSLKILFQYKDELIFLLEGILQWFYLHFHSALAGEHYYGLRRTANHRLRSLIISVFLPYVKVKLDSLQERIRSDATPPHAKFHLLLRILPKIQVFIDGICWLYRLSYGFGLSNYYSPTLQLANVKLTYAKDPSPIVTPPSLAARIVSILSQILSSGLFIIQMVDWWNTSHQSSVQTHENSLSVTCKKPTRTAVGSERACPLCRQACQVPTVVLGSGYAYCHACITDYVARYHRCPSTHQPVTHEQLIRIG